MFKIESMLATDKRCKIETSQSIETAPSAKDLTIRTPILSLEQRQDF